MNRLKAYRWRYNMKEDYFFKSRFHRYLYVIACLDKSQWHTELQVKLEMYYNKSLADEWYYEILNTLMIGKDKHNYPIVNYAIERLDSYYYNMIKE